MTLSAQHAGFTLIELMIVIVVLAIFVTVGVPSFQNLINDNRLVTQANRLVTSLHFARSEALKRRIPVTVCRSANGTSCVNDAAQTWETGWIVFQDTNNNGVVDGETIFQTVGTLSVGNTLRAAAPINQHISFQPTGLQDSLGGDFRLCSGINPDVNEGRRVRITTTGRLQTDKGSTIGGLASCP